MGKMMNSVEREREEKQKGKTGSVKLLQLGSVLGKREWFWVVHVDTVRREKNQTARADCPFRPGGFSQQAGFSVNFDG